MKLLKVFVDLLQNVMDIELVLASFQKTVAHSQRHSKLCRIPKAPERRDN